MARQPRLVIPGLAHYALLRGHNGQPVAVDEDDRRALLQALREATGARGVAVHAYAVLDDEVHLLLRPETAGALGTSMQNLGRRYVAQFNRRHQRTGTLWDGRFKASVIEPGSATLAALRRIDGLAPDSAACSSAARIGGARDAMLVDPPELWALGNTPFERELAYRRLLAQDTAVEAGQALDAAVRSGRIVGSERFLLELSHRAGRELGARPRGRPRRHQD